ncbi:GDP-fucose protein O-fucosyltransferase 1-like isoform X1 [Dysidea avara]|uniref:GDP-fucose protein O-fucosyltransferase 1-like isoform X1 n=1 Tax=Dysidea avara TaxID=196820 RepID=UPI00331A5930
MWRVAWYRVHVGRFGNQAAHLLGSIAFAKALNRTLVLPPWRILTYVNIPFTEWFQLEPIADYHKTVTMEQFMGQLAEDHWPPHQRRGYCKVAISEEKGCAMKEGNPYRPFWNQLGVEFVDSIYTGLSYDVHIPSVADDWMNKFPARQHLVIALRRAPARFPLLPHNRHLHKLLRWSAHITSIATEHVRAHMDTSPYLGLHFRIDYGWQQLCKDGVGQHSYLELLQCLDVLPDQVTSWDICYPSRDALQNQINQVLETHSDIKHVYIATDDIVAFDKLQLKFDDQITVQLSERQPQVDLFILARANQFIGICPSSFSAFIKRERDTLGLSSMFWELTGHVYIPEPDMLL